MPDKTAALLLEGLRCERGDPERAALLAQEALTRSEAISSPSHKARALRNLAYAHHAQGEIAQATELLQQAQQLAEALGDGSVQALCHHTWGFFYQQQGKLTEALGAYQQAAQLREVLGEDALLAGTLNNMGTACSQLGDSETSLKSHQKALQLWRSQNNHLGEVITLNNIGMVYTAFGQWESALTTLRASREAVKTIESLPVICETLTLLARACRLAGLRAEGEEALSQAQRLAEELPDQIFEASVLEEQAWFLVESGQWPLAKRALGQALRLLRRRKSSVRIAYCLHTLGALALKQGELPRACRALERCLGQAQRSGFQSLARDAHEQLADAWEARGELTQALAHFKSFHQLDRQLSTATSERLRYQLLQDIEMETVRQRNSELSKAKQLLEEANQRLQELASQDGMTGLANHRTFQESLHRALARAQGSTSLLLIDVDYFKTYNDAFGHPEGDVVLKQVALLIRELARPDDTLARYGGEEFAVLLPETPRAVALQLAGRIRRAIAGHAFAHKSVTVSIGVATATAGRSEASLLVSQADQALYAAKRAGRNCCRLYKPS